MRYKCNRDCAYRSNTGRCKYTGDIRGRLIGGKLEIATCGYKPAEKEGD